MGSCSSCCRRESPCGSAEETSGLLKDESKTVVPAGDTHVVGSCCLEGDDDIRKKFNEADIKEEVKVEVKQVPEFAVKDANNTQEIKPVHSEVVQTAPSPRKKSKLEENSARAQDEGDVKDRPAETGHDELLMQCTLSSPQKDSATAHWEVFPATGEVNPTSEQEKVPEICPENHTETNTTGKHITPGLSHDEDEASKVTVDNVAPVVEPLLEVSENNKVLSVPNTELSEAESTLNESPSRAVTEDSEVCQREAPEVIKSSPDVRESSPGPGPVGLDHSPEQDQDSASSLREPETTDPADASGSSKSEQDAGPDLECAAAGPESVTSPEIIARETGEEVTQEVQKKVGEVPEKEDKGAKGAAEAEEEEEEIYRTEEEIQMGKDAGTREEEEERGGKEEQKEEIFPTEEIPAVEKEESEDGLGNSDEDLYRGEEELSASQISKQGSPSSLETTLEDRCSLAPAVDILHYSEREWKGNTAKSALIRKGYKAMSQRFGSVRRVRGDNYCALRATLFQVLSHSTTLPPWLQDDDITMLPKQLEAQEGLISQWTLPGVCLEGDGAGDVTRQLKGYMELLKNKWQAAVDCPSASERQQLCERLFQGGEEELGLLEALKLLMLGRAVELHGRMQGGADVPLFCWLLFARDSSDCPRSFLDNHLRHVGLSAGLEQVEMFLLGYALHCTIQVYRLYKADTEEFVTFYPDDHKDEWPSVCLVTEDDRHYNVPVDVLAVEGEEGEAAENAELSDSS